MIKEHTGGRLDFLIATQCPLVATYLICKYSGPISVDGHFTFVLSYLLLSLCVHVRYFMYYGYK